MKKIITLILFLLSTLSWAKVDPKSAYALQEAGKAVIIDVREENEIKDGMIEGAKWFPLSKAKAEADFDKELLTMTRDKKVFLYCRSGRRSGMFQDMMKKKNLKAENLGGYEDLKSILPVTKP